MRRASALARHRVVEPPHCTSHSPAGVDVGPTMEGRADVDVGRRVRPRRACSNAAGVSWAGLIERRGDGCCQAEPGKRGLKPRHASVRDVCTRYRRASAMDGAPAWDPGGRRPCSAVSIRSVTGITRKSVSSKRTMSRIVQICFCAIRRARVRHPDAPHRLGFRHGARPAHFARR